MEHLPWMAASEVFCKDFVDINYDNTSFRILEALLWFKLFYFPTTIAFWFAKYLFPIDRDTKTNYVKDFTLCSIIRSNQPLWKICGVA